MKITKRQLRRIIKEEKAKLINEQGIPQGLIENLYNAMQAIHDQNPDIGVDVIMEEVSGFMDSIGASRGYTGLY